MMNGNWQTDTESTLLDGGGVARIERQGTRWRWYVSVTTRDTAAQLEALGYAATQDGARREAVRVAGWLVTGAQIALAHDP